MSRPKRKAAALSQAAHDNIPGSGTKSHNNNPSTNTTRNASTSTSPTEKTGLRRSDRRSVRTTRNSNVPEKGAGLLPMPKSGHISEASKKEIRKEAEMAKEGVQDAIHELARFEQKLQRETKRQKLKIEESVVLSTKDTKVEAATKPRTTRMEDSMDYPNRKELNRKVHAHTVEQDLADAADGDGDGDDAAWERAAREIDPGGEHDENLEIADRGATRPPAVNSDYLPLPWKGRLGYACLNTYLRAAKFPVFSSRTCRIASIIEHRHPLADPSLPEHATKNRPDKHQPACHALGQTFVESLGLANAQDIVKMLRWNEKYGIRFMRLSSEMFPFASHEEYGYKLAPFASGALADAGKVAAEYGHRLTTHPGQFTQLGSPLKEVINNSVRDLEYHDELLSLLKLPPQQDRDAVMVLHMGGTYGDKAATIDRFRKNYTSRLSVSIKRRLVLENDDVSWSVHELLPVCEELNIPLVLDYHHHNIVFNASEVREGTYDISQPELSNRIANTWKRKNITQKMHYSESCTGAITPRDRRKHSPRVKTLPPCPPDMDLMIEAKDKEQAVFELMRTFKLPGHQLICDIIPYEREDESRPPLPQKKAKKLTPKKRRKKGQEPENDGDEDVKTNPNAAKDKGLGDITANGGVEVNPEDFGMGGPLGRVYWPPGMDEWLKPKKRERKPKADGGDAEGDE